VSPRSPDGAAFLRPLTIGLKLEYSYAAVVLPFLYSVYLAFSKESTTVPKPISNLRGRPAEPALRDMGAAPKEAQDLASGVLRRGGFVGRRHHAA